MNHLDMAQRQIEDRAELGRVRAELAIQRKVLANLEERELTIVGRMDERLIDMTALLEADKVIGLMVKAPALDVTIETTPVDADADAVDLAAVDLAAVSDGPVDRANGLVDQANGLVDRPNGAAAF